MNIPVNVFFLLCICYFERSLAHIPVKKCTKIEVMQNFNLTSIMGVWYGITRYPIDDLFKYNCDKREYTAVENMDPIMFKASYVLGKTPSDLENNRDCDTLMAHFRKDPVHNPHCKNGRYFVKFLKPEGNSWLEFSIIDTDYNNYLVIYSCHDNPSILRPKKEYASILGREPILSYEFVKRALDAFDKYKIDKSKLIPISRNCYGEPKNQYY